MPPRLLDLSPPSKAGLAEPRAESGWPEFPERPFDPILAFMIVVHVVFLGFIASVMLAISLQRRREQRERGTCTCGGRRTSPEDSADIEAANGSSDVLLPRTSSEGGTDGNSSQLESSSSTTKIPDETNNGKSDVPLGPPPYNS